MVTNIDNNARIRQLILKVVPKETPLSLIFTERKLIVPAAY